MRRADLRDVDLQRRVLADEHTRGARVVEVDVREEEVPDVGELEPALGEAGLQVRRCTVVGPQSKSAGPLVGLEQVAGDDPGRLVVEVDRLRHSAI